MKLYQIHKKHAYDNPRPQFNMMHMNNGVPHNINNILNQIHNMNLNRNFGFQYSFVYNNTDDKKKGTVMFVKEQAV